LLIADPVREPNPGGAPGINTWHDRRNTRRQTMSHLLQLLAALALVVAAAKLAGAAATRFGQAAVFGELLAGLLLGPTALDVFGWGPLAVTDAAHPPLLPALQDLADIGVILLMFVAGLETDLAALRRVGGTAFWAAAGGVALPMLGGIATTAAFGLPVVWTGIFVGTILTATSVSISAQTLMELGVLKSKEGATILGAAVIDDVMGIVILSVVVALAQTSGPGGAAQAVTIAARISCFFAAAWMIGGQFDTIAAWGDRLPVNQGLLAIVMVVTLVYAWMAEAVGGVAPITGAYVAGVLFTRTRFKGRIDGGIHALTYSLLVPVFFISIGLRANARELGPHAAFTLALVVVAVTGKVIGCGAFARLCGFSTGEALRVGAGMISRGEVGLIVAGYGLAHGLVGPDVFSASVLVVLATTMMTPPLLRASFARPRLTVVAVEEAIAHAPGPDR
jgi:Kef-type K+ transport system membrane component KefB